MKKLFCCLVLVGNQINALGTHLTTLTEASGEIDFSVLFKKQEKPRYSALVARSTFNLLHSPEEYQVVAAWLQAKWLQNDAALLDRMEMSDRWKDRGERVKKLIRVFAQASVSEKSLIQFYEESFHKIELKDRCIPGCGNRPKALLRPDVFASKVINY